MIRSIPLESNVVEDALVTKFLLPAKSAFQLWLTYVAQKGHGFRSRGPNLLFVTVAGLCYNPVSYSNKAVAGDLLQDTVLQPFVTKGMARPVTNPMLCSGPNGFWGLIP